MEFLLQCQVKLPAKLASLVSLSSLRSRRISQCVSSFSSYNISIQRAFGYQSFLKAFRPDLSPTTAFALQTLDGGSNPQATHDAGIEAVRSIHS